MKVNKFIYTLLVSLNILLAIVSFVGVLKRDRMLKECERRFEMYKYQVEQGCFVNGGWNCE